MPLYEFMCDDCMKLTTKLLRPNDKRKIIKCSHCGHETAKKIISAPGGFDIKGYSAKNGYSKGEK